MKSNYKEVKGDLIELALKGEFDVIAHGVNCQCVQGSGIAVGMKNNFFTNRFKGEEGTSKGNIDKLGNIQAEFFMIHKDGAFSPLFNGWSKEKHIKDLWVVNAYTQFNYGKNHSDGDAVPLSYEALTLCMRKINHRFKGQHIGLPKIGAGLAGGDWNRIKSIIQNELTDCDVTIVIYERV